MTVEWWEIWCEPARERLGMLSQPAFSGSGVGRREVLAEGAAGILLRPSRSGWSDLVLLECRVEGGCAGGGTANDGLREAGREAGRDVGREGLGGLSNGLDNASGAGFQRL